MKDLDDLKRETSQDLADARQRREERQTRERRDGPILDAFDRMAAATADRPLDLPGDKPGRRHTPRMAVLQHCAEPCADHICIEMIREGMCKR